MTLNSQKEDSALLSFSNNVIQYFKTLRISIIRKMGERERRDVEQRLFTKKKKSKLVCNGKQQNLPYTMVEKFMQ